MDFLPPIEPNSDMRQAAIHLRGTFKALLDAGFTSDEAMMILLKMMETAGR